ncbi:barstar family protein [Spirosoma sp.]|uniref:barstar family protein n=1 Tax=Spirosoma sp. TaxID=1899569 RepID=UPI003B3A9AF3
MTPNVYISQSESELESHFSGDFIAHIDGKKVITLRDFYEEIAVLLDFPDGFGFNLDALNDYLNDLQWLEDERIILYFTSTETLISKERDPAKMGSILNILEATAEDWKWVDEDDDADKKEIILVFEDSLRIRKLLEQESINYALLSVLK